MRKILNFFKKIRSNMTASIIISIIVLMSLLGVGVCVVGNYALTNAYKQEYATVTYHMADAASTFVNGDHLDDYLAGNELEEYEKTKNSLDLCCIKLNVSLIYVIQVDTTDYGRFVSIFNSVNNAVDNSNYTPWELGYRRNASNDEYRNKYRTLYNKEVAYETIFRFNTTDGQHPHITTLVPILDSTNTVTGILCVQRPINEMAAAMRPYLFAIILSVIIIAAVISTLTVLGVNALIINPIRRISKEATRFANESTIGNPPKKLGRFEVILNLANSIYSMEEDTVKYIENITASAAEKERIGAELSIASNIQIDSLPRVENAFAGRKDFNIFASMNPAKEVGGDFYNFFLIDDDHLALVIADVSGKGIPAALFMMVTNIVISDRTKMGGTPKEILEYANENIEQHNQTGMFVTVWLGILELSTGKLITANAGHEDPIIYHKNKDEFEISKEKHGFVLGCMAGIQYTNQEIKLEKGDKIFVFTDGLSEAKNVEHKMYGINRIVSTLNKNKDQEPKELLTSVTEDVKVFVGEEPQFDDLTMLCIELK